MLKEKNLRTRRLFRNNGRSLVIAMDHARVFDTVTGLKNIAEVVKAVRAGGADSILTPWGSTVAAAAALDGGGCWLSVDVTPQSITSTVEMALRLGVDGIKVEVYPWCDPKDDYFKRYHGNESVLHGMQLAAECQKWNPLPTISVVAVSAMLRPACVRRRMGSFLKTGSTTEWHPDFSTWRPHTFP